GTKWNKNVPRQIEALRGLRCHVRLIGPMTPEIQEALIQHRVDYSSEEFISDDALHQRYEEADMILFASVLEGFGMPIIEANRVGRPVVPGTVTAMPEAAGNAALLVDPLSPASIRAGVDRVVQDQQLRDRLVRDGYDNARRFDVASIANQYAET